MLQLNAHVADDRVLDAYRDAIFCLQPWGDSGTRQGFWDAIAAGCIPVIFETHSWRPASHFLGVELNKICVRIPLEHMRVDGMGALAYLRSLPVPTVRALQYEVLQARGRCQYSRYTTTPGGDAVDRMVSVVAAQFRQRRDGQEGFLPDLP